MALYIYTHKYEVLQIVGFESDDFVLQIKKRVANTENEKDPGCGFRGVKGMGIHAWALSQLYTF